MSLAREQHDALTQIGNQETEPKACTTPVSSVEKAGPGPPVQSVRIHAFRGSARSQAGQVAPYALSEGQGALKPAEQRRKSTTPAVQAVQICRHPGSLPGVPSHVRNGMTHSRGQCYE